MVCVCCVSAQQCCCDAQGARVLGIGEECASATFPVPNPAKTATFIFEWCGLIAEKEFIVTDFFFASEVMNALVCATTGRYGTEESYTVQTFKELAVTPGQGSGSGCGFQKDFVISAADAGVGHKIIVNTQTGEEFDVDFEAITNVELYNCTIKQCFDGSEAEITVALFDASPDNTCGTGGCYEPCNFTDPEVSVVVAP